MRLRRCARPLRCVSSGPHVNPPAHEDGCRRADGGYAGRSSLLSPYVSSAPERRRSLDVAPWRAGQWRESRCTKDEGQRAMARSAIRKAAPGRIRAQVYRSALWFATRHRRVEEAYAASSMTQPQRWHTMAVPVSTGWGAAQQTNPVVIRGRRTFFVLPFMPSSCGCVSHRRHREKTAVEGVSRTSGSPTAWTDVLDGGLACAIVRGHHHGKAEKGTRSTAGRRTHYPLHPFQIAPSDAQALVTERAMEPFDERIVSGAAAATVTALHSPSER